MLHGKVLEVFESQAEVCIAMGSPFTGQLCQLLAEGLDEETRFGARLQNWPEDKAAPDAIALRACGALQALVLRNMAPELADCYPPHEVDDNDLWTAVSSAIATHDDYLHDYLDSAPQTNETRRSSMILGAALMAVKKFGMPLSIAEIGASAGLNLWFPAYGYDFGADNKWGVEDPVMSMRSEWSGDLPPLDVEIEVVERAASDRQPLDLRNEDARLRLMSYIWPDQLDRVVRTGAAIQHAASQDFTVETADAADWTEDYFSRPAKSGTIRFFYHTIFWQYLPQNIKERITAAVEAAGAAATPETPLVWFRFESDDKKPGGVMHLTSWPGGETVELGRADFHGQWVEWTPQ